MMTDLNKIKSQALKLLEDDNIDQYMSLLDQHPTLYGEGDKLVDYYTSRLSTIAVKKDSPELIEFFVRKGANVNGEGRTIPLIQCCLGGDCRPKSAQKLIELGSDVNFENEGILCCEALNLAISKQNIEMVKLMIDNGALLNAIVADMTSLDRAVKVGNQRIVELLKLAGGKTAEELGHRPHVPSSADRVKETFEERFMEETEGTIQGLIDTELPVDIHIIEALRDYALFTTGMSERPLPVGPDAEAMRWPEIILRIPSTWPRGEELVKNAEYSWAVQWLRKLAMKTHLRQLDLGRLFFWPNGSPPEPFAPNTEMCYWMLLAAVEEPIFVSEEKSVGIYTAVPLYKEEYDLVQSQGLGALGQKFDENDIGPSEQMIVRKNVAV